jgi:hypothetical protein
MARRRLWTIVIAALAVAGLILVPDAVGAKPRRPRPHRPRPPAAAPNNNPRNNNAFSPTVFVLPFADTGGDTGGDTFPEGPGPSRNCGDTGCDTGGDTGGDT